MPDRIRLFSPEPEDGAGENASPAVNDRAIITVRDVVQRYLDDAQGRYVQRALDERRRVLALFLKTFGSRALDACNPADLSDWVRKQKRWKSPWTRRMAVQFVQRPFNWAVHMRLIAANPFQGLTLEEGEPRRPMTDAELRGALRHSDALFRRVILFLRHTGCRPGEMSIARWPDVDWVRACIILERHKSRKKTRKPRVIPLTPLALRLLRWMRARATDANGLIFVNTKGNPWNRCNLSIRMQKLRWRAGLPKDCYLYGTRHAFGTEGVLNGANLKLLSKAMGHGSVSTTERYYVHIDQEIDAMRDAAAKATTKRPRSTI